MTVRQQWRWSAWALATVGGFALIEHAAYTTGSHPTLTAVLRFWLGIAPVKPGRTVRAAVAAGAVAGGLVVLAVHLARVPVEEPVQRLRLVA